MKNNLLFVLLLFFSGTLFGQKTPARPSPPKLVNDYVGLLTPDQQSHLEQKLVAYDDSTSVQIVVVIVKTLDDYAPVDYAVKLGRDWGVGNKKTNNGVVFLISMDPAHRDVFIAPGYGLEGAIPDITAKQIIESEIIPQFKQDNYFRGIDQGVDAIIQASRGEYKAPEGYNDRRGKGKGGGGGFIFIIILVVIFLVIGRGGGGRGRGGGMMSRRGFGALPFLFFPSGGGGGWSGGGGGSSGGGGGGFGGFGGGSFGGGGSGGSW